MRPTARKVRLNAPAIILALAMTACAAASESASSVNEAAEQAFATCRTASITVDSRTRYQAPIAGFLEQARTSGCTYGAIEIADAPPESKSQAEDHVGAVEVARDFIDAFELSWRLQPETVDPDLSANTLRVTVLAPGDADRAVAAAQAPAARYR